MQGGRPRWGTRAETGDLKQFSLLLFCLKMVDAGYWPLQWGRSTAHRDAGKKRRLAKLPDADKRASALL